MREELKQFNCYSSRNRRIASCAATHYYRFADSKQFRFVYEYFSVIFVFKNIVKENRGKCCQLPVNFSFARVTCTPIIGECCSEDSDDGALNGWNSEVRLRSVCIRSIIWASRRHGHLRNEGKERGITTLSINIYCSNNNLIAYNFSATQKREN
jgi:hypothetical protein